MAISTKSGWQITNTVSTVELYDITALFGANKNQNLMILRSLIVAFRIHQRRKDMMLMSSAVAIAMHGQLSTRHAPDTALVIPGHRFGSRGVRAILSHACLQCIQLPGPSVDSSVRCITIAFISGYQVGSTL